MNNYAKEDDANDGEPTSDYVPTEWDRTRW
jgi:hypothetical protein